MEVELIAITKYLDGDSTPEALIEHAGRVCCNSEGHGDPGKFIRARLDAGHESIVEHASATFEISGISRACSHQLVRHRLASFSMRSQRYVDGSNLLAVLPPAIEDNEDALHAYSEFLDDAESAYVRLRELGIKKEDARFVLPNATQTQIVATMNFRSLLNFFRLRLAPQAQWEIREMAQQMLELIEPHAPSVFASLLT